MSLFRTLYERAQQLDDRLGTSPVLHRVKHVVDAFLPVAVVILAVVLYLEFFGNLGHQAHAQVLFVEKLLLAYFVLELLVDLAVYEDNRAFLRHKWLDILLIIPFLTVINGVGQALKAVKGLKGVKPAKTAKPLKPAKAAQSAKTAKTTKTWKVAQNVPQAKKFVKRIKKTQHTAKAVKKGKEVLHKYNPFSE